MLHYVGVSPAQRRRVYMECTLAATSLNQSEPKISTDCTCASNPIRSAVYFPEWKLALTRVTEWTECPRVWSRQGTSNESIQFYILFLSYSITFKTQSLDIIQSLSSFLKPLQGICFFSFWAASIFFLKKVNISRSCFSLNESRIPEHANKNAVVISQDRWPIGKCRNSSGILYLPKYLCLYLKYNSIF
jgi:hypothetical protein